jgi:hypothetical protein
MSTKAKTDSAELFEATGGVPATGVELPRELRDRLCDEVIDELLAGACRRRRLVGPGKVLARLTRRQVARVLAAEFGWASRLRAAPGAAGRDGQQAQRLERENAADRAGPGRDPDAARSQRQLRAAAGAERGSGGSRGSTRRSSRSTRAGCRRGRSRRTWPRCTASRSGAT